MSPDTVVPPRLDVRLRRFQGSILAAEYNVDPATALDDAVDIRVPLTDLLPERYECAAGRVARPRLAARPQRRDVYVVTRSRGGAGPTGSISSCSSRTPCLPTVSVPESWDAILVASEDVQH
ncbi:hypothetical protein ACIA47_17685 [Micromonospora sp. NPDC051227]|uniref:hypothetical protein n=1 Tax=Micromonospora sp. NPDC051227 TaxID=3364285 RepID=UPI00378A9AA4